jgi:hypothetical protein
MLTPAQEIVKYFVDKTGKRATQGWYAQQIGIVNTLFKTGFTFDEVKTGIDFVMEHPPVKGFSSLGLLGYVLEDVLIKAKAKEIKEQQQSQWQHYEDMNKHDDYSNQQKFQQNNKPKVKGS